MRKHCWCNERGCSPYKSLNLYEERENEIQFYKEPCRTPALIDIRPVQTFNSESASWQVGSDQSHPVLIFAETSGHTELETNVKFKKIAIVKCSCCKLVQQLPNYLC